MATAAKPRQLTIGAVCGMLKEEFPDISISKIRYLEDQGLLAPRRTQGGYRLFSEDDVERLETILRLQRDEFLPLRVIRQELASPVAVERKGAFVIEDQGSLNGTFVNRKRVESAELEDGDELQIGKYRLTFLDR